MYGPSCINCHSSNGFGHTVTDAVYGIVGQTKSTIPAGNFGDPDRGEGPLPTYIADPGSIFTLELQVKDTTLFDPAFTPIRWAVGLKRIYTTDPDYHTGNPDPISYRDNELLMVGHLNGPDYDYPDPAPNPSGPSQWSLYTSGNSKLQYYASTGNGGHDWIGPFLLSVDITVPSGVHHGWYDLEVSAAGWDYDQDFAFYDEQHFYLNVTPEPATCCLFALGGLCMRRRNRSRPK